MQVKNSPSVWGFLARCFGANKEDEVKEVTKTPVVLDSKERETRIKLWVTESQKMLLELVEPGITSDEVSKSNEEQLNMEEDHTFQQDRFTPKRKAVNGRQHKCKPDRNNASTHENIDPQQHTPCHSVPCQTTPNAQCRPPRCIADTFRSMVPDAFDALSNYTPPAIQQRVSVPTWLATTCTSSRK